MANAKTNDGLPFGVEPGDTKWPEFGTGLSYSEFRDLGLGVDSGFPGHFTFYKTERFGWVLTTLHISAAGRRAKAGTTDRTYGIAVGTGEIVRVGHGPHVTATVTVYLAKGSVDRLRRYVDLWKKGMAAAGDIRDRISTRRANTIARRDRLPRWWE